MAHQQGKVLEVFSQSDIPEAAAELLHDKRVTAVAARGCFKAIPVWHNWAYQNPVATEWINSYSFSKATTEVLRQWLTRHYHRSILGVADGWRHDKQARGGIDPHIDYLRPHRVADVVGGLSMSVCRSGSGTFFAERLQATGFRRLLRVPPAPSAAAWQKQLGYISKEFTAPFGVPIEHEASDGIIFAGYPTMTVHAVEAEGSFEHSDTSSRVAELFDHRLVVPNTYASAA